MKTRYELNHLSEFTCLLGDCPQSCCCGPWDTPIDNKTFTRWQNEANAEFRSRLMASTKTDSGDPRMHILHRTDGGCCVHLDEQGMCGVRQRAGYDSIPENCQTYPHIRGESPDHSILSASLSCPAIADFVLPGAESKACFTIKGRPEQVPVDDNGVLGDAQIIWYLESIIQKTLSAYAYPLSIRLLSIAKLLADLRLQFHAGTMSEAFLRDRLEQNDTVLQQLQKETQSKNYEVNTNEAAKWWRTIHNAAINIMDDSSLRDIADLLVTDEEGNSVSNEIYYQRFTQLRDQALPALQKYNGVHKRYLEVNFVNNGFPCQPVQGYIAAFLQSVFPFAIVQYLGTLLINKGSDFSEHILIKNIYQTERFYSHSHDLAKQLTQQTEALEIDRYYFWFRELC